MIDPDLLLQGYRLGVFPMAMEDGTIEWFSPDPRAILPLEDFHVPHALRRLLRKKVFEIKINNSFSEVIKACAKREDTWINREILESYTQMHELGHALGLKHGQTLQLVVIPQALRVIIPPLTSQYLNLTKNSSLAVAIGYPDFVNVFTGIVLNQTGQAVEVIAITMGVYLTLSLLTSAFMNWYNQRRALVER